MFRVHFGHVLMHFSAPIIGLTLVQISGYHFFGGGQLISKFKVRNCTPPGGEGPPEANFVNKLESTSIRVYRGGHAQK